MKRWWTWLGPLAVVAGFAAAREVGGVPSAVLAGLAALGLVVWLVALLLRTVRTRAAAARAGAPARGGWRIFVLVFALTLVVVLLASILLRDTLLRPWQRREENVWFDPELGWAPGPRPGESAERFEGTVGARLDRIDPDREHGVFLGDSVMFGWSVETPLTAVGLLDREVDDVQVLNASVPGYDFASYLGYLQRILPGLRPRFVVIAPFVGNDLLTSRSENAFGHMKPLYVLDGDGIRRATERWEYDNCPRLLGSSLLWSLLWAVFPPDPPNDVLNWLCNVETLAPEEVEEMVSRVFRETARVIRQHGAKPAILLVPEMEELMIHGEADRKETQHDFVRVHRILEEGAARDGYTFIDLKPLLVEELHARGLTPERIYIPGDSCHWNELGNRIVADILKRELLIEFGVD